MRTHFLGLDMAWGEGSVAHPANETGVAAIDGTGEVLAAGWTRGIDETVAWVSSACEADALMAVDAPLVVRNVSGQRLCERQVGQRYGRWQVSANTTNLATPRLAGVALLKRLVEHGWHYWDCSSGPPGSDRAVFECYPYTTLVGAEELGYDEERPRYKRKPKAVAVTAWRPVRAAACDQLLQRLRNLETADPPLLLASHPVTAELLEEKSPVGDAAYKHREDLIDALLCAWTASLLSRHGLSRCQVLGLTGEPGPQATIVAPARPEQRPPG